MELPPSLLSMVDTWKRPHEIIADKVPVVVDLEESKEIDLFSRNIHLLHSEVMRCIVCQVVSLWTVRDKLLISEPDWDHTHSSWSPWDHIHPRSKGSTLPAYNPAGKYAVKLYWMVS